MLETARKMSDGFLGYVLVPSWSSDDDLLNTAETQLTIRGPAPRIHRKTLRKILVYSCAAVGFH